MANDGVTRRYYPEDDDSVESRIRRLRQPTGNAFEDDANEMEADAAAAEELGVSVDEYRRGRDVGVWRRGPETRTPPFNARLLGTRPGAPMHQPLLKERRAADQAVRRNAKNDT